MELGPVALACRMDGDLTQSTMWVTSWVSEVNTGCERYFETNINLHKIFNPNPGGLVANMTSKAQNCCV